MSGVFAEWQPRYAERGVATFPVENKRPRVSHWQRVGLKGSSQLAMKFADADAFGFQCGVRSRITLIDIDSGDERSVVEAIKLFGESPIIWRTGSGNHAMPFRHNGEARRIRPIPEMPIDVLGRGLAVAPPSFGSKRSYEFLQGSLADFDRLPMVRLRDVEQAEPQHNNQDRIHEGKRGDFLFRFALAQAPYVDDLDALLDVVLTRNMSCTPPLPDSEVMRLVTSAWEYEQRGANLVGRGQAIVVKHALVDGLMHDDPDAFLLLTLLKRHHWGRDFCVANAMAEIMPGEGWTVRRLRNARNTLIERNHIELVHPGGYRLPPSYRLTQMG
jgi:hypothetical protein